MIDRAQFGDAADVDEMVEPGQPQREHRDEALPTCEHLGIVAELGQQADRVVDRGRRVIVERCRFDLPHPLVSRHYRR